LDAAGPKLLATSKQRDRLHLDNSHYAALSPELWRLVSFKQAVKVMRPEFA
jgi:hypothetical protein